MCIYIYIYIYVVYVYVSRNNTLERRHGHVPRHSSYEESTWLAETRLAQNTLNYLKIASSTLT